MTGDSGEITVFLKDSGDAQVGKSLLQVEVSGDEHPGHKHICAPREQKVTQMSRRTLPLFQAALGEVMMRHLSSQPLRSQNSSPSTERGEAP